METHRLEYFLCIAEQGSISGAARILGIAQPALSRQLRLLEDDLGITLVERTRSGVRLTAEGEHFRDSAAAPLRQLERAVKYAGSPLARQERGLILGMSETTAEILAAPLIDNLTAAFPTVTFSIVAESSHHLVEAMLQGIVDVSIINPTTDDRVFYHALLDEDLVLVGGPKSDLSPDRPIAFPRMAELPLVASRSLTGVGSELQKAALRTGASLRCRTTTDSHLVMKLLIAAGHVYGVLPLSAVHHEITSGGLRFAPMCNPTLKQELGVAGTVRLDLPRGFIVKVGNMIRDVVASLITSGNWQARFLSSQPFDRQSV